MDVVLYTNGCPKCTVLKAKLDQKKIPYTENTSMDEMMQLGFTSLPVLSVDGKFLQFNDAVKWVNH